jgi:hypothetical protein
MNTMPFLGDKPINRMGCQAGIVRYSPEVEPIVLPAPNPGKLQPTSFEHAARLMIDAHIAGGVALGRQRAGSHLRLARR